MFQPKPLKDTYNLTKETKKDLKSIIKPPFDHALKGNEKFIDEIAKLNWESLSSKDVLTMILVILSYGLKKDHNSKTIFEDYMKKENMKSGTSIFKFIRDDDGLRLKNCLNSDAFFNIFSSLFKNKDLCAQTLDKIIKRVQKIKSKDFTDTEVAEINLLIKTIMEGRETNHA